VTDKISVKGNDIVAKLYGKITSCFFVIIGLISKSFSLIGYIFD